MVKMTSESKPYKTYVQDLVKYSGVFGVCSTFHHMKHCRSEYTLELVYKSALSLLRVGSPQ